jgi:hypothetical protein
MTQIWLTGSLLPYREEEVKCIGLRPTVGIIEQGGGLQRRWGLIWSGRYQDHRMDEDWS